MFRMHRTFAWITLAGLMLLSGSALAAPHELDVKLEGGKLRLPLIGPVDLGLTKLGKCDLLAGVNCALKEGCHVAVTPDRFSVSLDPSKLPCECDAVKKALRTFTEVAAPQATADQRRTWGLLMPKTVEPKTRMVVLLHGLDCSR